MSAEVKPEHTKIVLMDSTINWSGQVILFFLISYEINTDFFILSPSSYFLKMDNQDQTLYDGYNMTRDSFLSLLRVDLSQIVDGYSSL